MKDERLRKSPSPPSTCRDVPDTPVVGLFAEGVSEHRLRCGPQESHLGVLAHQAQATQLSVAGFEEVEKVKRQITIVD